MQVNKSPSVPEEALHFYERRATSYFACQADQRFGYCLYVPEAFSFEDASSYRLCVVVHGTTRTANVYRDHFKEFAEANRAIVVAPMFPAGIAEARDLAGYKFIEFHGIRYDQLLLEMVAEIADRYRLSETRFLAFGFSGGGHFVHRFFYLHPEQLLAVSIGAPGMVTLIDDTLPWWRGTADVEERFGRRIDLKALRQVPVQMVIGAEDTEVWEITIEPGTRFWMEGANDAGETRIDRINTLARNFEDNGISVQLDIVPGVAHYGYDVLGPVKDFFAAVLRRHREDLQPVGNAQAGK